MATLQTFCSFVRVSAAWGFLPFIAFDVFICARYSNVISTNVTRLLLQMLSIFMLLIFYFKKWTSPWYYFVFLLRGNDLLKLHSPRAMLSFHQSVSPPLCNQVCLWAISSANHGTEGWLTKINLHPCEQSAWEARALALALFLQHFTLLVVNGYSDRILLGWS